MNLDFPARGGRLSLFACALLSFTSVALDLIFLCPPIEKLPTQTTHILPPHTVTTIDRLVTEIGQALPLHTSIRAMDRLLTAFAQTIPLCTRSNVEKLLKAIGQAFPLHTGSGMKRLPPEIAITYSVPPCSSRYLGAAFRYINKANSLLDGSPKRPQHQISKMGTNMINQEYQVTIGMEFEAIVAFHQTLLEGILRSINSNMEIIKEISDADRVGITQVHPRYQSTRPKYMGWGLTTPTSYGSNEEDTERQRRFRDNLTYQEVRGYAGEVLSLVKLILGEGVFVHDSWAKCKHFELWHLTHDNSLVGVFKHILASKLEAMGHQVENIDDWDAHPIELVSRILLFSPQSLNEIFDFLARLVGSPLSQHAAFVNEWCGTHVHVGLPVPANPPPGALPPSFTLPTLQHLAYILVMYEKAIMKLFPESRRAGSENADYELRTNLSEFFQEVEDDSADDNLSPEEYEAKYPYPEDFTFASARDKIFAQDITLQKLVKLMCPGGKNHLVNFQNLLRTDGMPRTIEFRQMEGNLDGRDATMWASFVVGLVRLAEWNGREYGVGRREKWWEDRLVWGYKGRGYVWTERSEYLEVMDLIQMMRWDGGRDWVRERVAKFAVEESDDA